MVKRSKKININLVAERAGVSLASVSRVVNNHPDVSESLRKKVMTVVEEINFTPNKGAERVFRIGVIVGTGKLEVTDYVAALLSGMGRYVDGRDLELSVCMNTRHDLLRTCRLQRCDAVMMICGEYLLERVPALASAGLPVMLINTPLQGERIGFISHDSLASARQLLRCLTEVGHRNIAYLSVFGNHRKGRGISDNHQERAEAYREAMRAQGKSPEQWFVPKLLDECHGEILSAKEVGYRQTIQLLARSPEVTAIACANDEIALGCHKACFDLGKKIPEDISVVGFDDQSFAGYLSPGLTTVRQPLAAMAAAGIHALEAFLKGEQTVLPQEYLPTELMIRGSVAPPRTL